MQQVASGVEQQLGGFNRQETAEILHEGWAQKESRHLGLWRPRWLVLFRDRRSQLPVLCTFKHARADWSASPSAPAATERIPLVGAICVPSRELVRGTPNVFWVQARSGNYFFAAGRSSECEKWARAIGESAAEAALRTSRAGGRPTSPIAQFGSPHFASAGDSPGSLRPPMASPGAISRIAAASSSCLAVAPSSAGTPADADASLPPMASLEALVHGLEGGLHVGTRIAAPVPKPVVLVAATAGATSTEPPTGIAASVVGGSAQMRGAAALGLSAAVFGAGSPGGRGAVAGGRGGGSSGSSGTSGAREGRHVSWQTAAAPPAEQLVERISTDGTEGTEGTDESYLDNYDEDGSTPPATQAVGAAAGRPASSSCCCSGGEVAAGGGEGSSAALETALETLARDRAALQAQLAALIAHEHAAGAKAEVSHAASHAAAAARAAVMAVALGRTESEDSIGDGVSGREALRQQNDVLAAQIDVLRSTLGRLAIVELREALDESELHEAELVAELEAAAEAAAEAARGASAADVLAIALLGAACAAEAVAHALDTWTRGYVVAQAVVAQAVDAQAAEAARRANLASDISTAVVHPALAIRMTEEPAARGLAAAATNSPEDAKTTCVATSAASSERASDELNSLQQWFRRSVAGLVDVVTERSAEVLRMIDGPDDAVSPSASRTTSGNEGTVGIAGASSATAPATAPATVADSSSSSISPRRSRELALKELIVAGFTNEPWAQGFVKGFEATSFAGATDSPATAPATVADSPTRLIGSSANGHAPRRASFEAAHHLLPFDSDVHALDLDAPPPPVAPAGAEVEAVLQVAHSPRAAATDALVTADGAAQDDEGSALATDRASSRGTEAGPEAAAARAAVEGAIEARVVAGARQEEVAALEEALAEVRERMGIYRQQLQQLGDVPERWGSSDSLPVYDEYDVDYDEGEEENEAYVPFGMGGQGEDRPSVLPWEALRT